jgi:hypothetical protein
MSRSRRGTIIGLLLMGLAVGLLFAASIVNPQQLSFQVAMVVGLIYAAIASLALVKIQMPSFQIGLPNVSAAVRTSPVARRAVQRAQSRGDYGNSVPVTDLGLIVNEHGPRGLNRHLAQIVSLDDEAVQPFVQLHATADQANRIALVEFDIFDQSGQHRFSRTVQQWIRDGDNQIFCDRQLPLGASDLASVRAGVWDLRVKIDGFVAAVHSFTVNPSTAERRRQYSADGEASIGGLATPDQEQVLSLEDLLREQQRSHRNNS